MKTYTFHVSLPGFGRVWRKLELPGEATLADLHIAIQDAYDFDRDHLYSFFMSGKAWDSATEYSLPEGASPWGGSWAGEDVEEEEGGEGEEDVEEISEPALDDLRAMFEALKSDPALRDKLIAETGMPAGMLDMALNNSDQIMGLLAGGIDDVLGIFTGEPGDVLTTTLDSLELQVGKSFLYLFDYGDSWKFKVRVHAINPDADAGAVYPRIVESVGEAPSQYGGEWDEEDEGDEEAEA
jgi:hypothetical protein